LGAESRALGGGSLFGGGKLPADGGEFGGGGRRRAEHFVGSGEVGLGGGELSLGGGELRIEGREFGGRGFFGRGETRGEGGFFRFESGDPGG
jgi:hypothetical protein